ncbi:2-amino-4-hydroxy-6-hydroxymethyldihydropteridine diphosphokinase [Qingshengfaniella alkalisoli]|uniref:2-amino-4-hydroxy-6-hydroxymethyldihydropteridine pyrophosphokinase n=1 Tax=Qingshengfaniella alkalisoli TaxID=2599296 RepID=A0A5B8I6T4_9RHOB|nr:2-amino-4-hydroxy-6-hydroxymethyldihydropteridine diphosphokinase [Qingshengfaniella alkalisoli]QDY68186.1 2-amino-4-hydroxy-6-hydroxymethyldihydropteridine diphosphokinase [Qingshengfaniella alkalisoli]
MHRYTKLRASQVSLHKFETLALVSLGGNLSSGELSPIQSLQDAAHQLDCFPFRIKQSSPVFATPCFPAGAGPDYVNAAVAISAPLKPAELLVALSEIEQEHGRERKRRWGARTLDLDLLAVGSVVLPDRPTFEHWRNLPLNRQQLETPTDLVLPHPRIQDRGFVLVPLARIAPDWRHPVLDRTVQQMLDDLPRSALEGIRELPEALI